MRRGDPAVESDVAAQVEFVGDEVEIAQRLWLRREVLDPVPFIQQFLRERVAVGVAFGIEAGTGITIPVPRAADVTAGLEHPHPEAEFAEAVELVHAGDAGADDDCVVVWRNAGAVLPLPLGVHPWRSLRIMGITPQRARRTYAVRSPPAPKAACAAARRATGTR